MVNVNDRVPGVDKANRKKITYDDGTIVYAKVENADDAVAGTAINRATLMAMQGFIGTTTVINADGSVTATNADGDTLVTVRNADSSVTYTFTSGTQVITKTVTKTSTGYTEAIT